MTKSMFDRDSWERRWQQALREHPDKLSSRPPNEYLLAEIGHVQPGFACLYVHVAGLVGEMVTRLGSGVAPGGTLFLVGHLPVDPATGAPSAAAGQQQVTVDTALEALDPRDWEILVSEERPHGAAGTGVDAVVRAVRRR